MKYSRENSHHSHKLYTRRNVNINLSNLSTMYESGLLDSDLINLAMICNNELKCDTGKDLPCYSVHVPDVVTAEGSCHGEAECPQCLHRDGGRHQGPGAGRGQRQGVLHTHPTGGEDQHIVWREAGGETRHVRECCGWRRCQIPGVSAS